MLRPLTRSVSLRSSRWVAPLAYASGWRVWLCRISSVLDWQIMKKAFLLLSIFSALSFSLWLARQLADSNSTPETASEAFLKGDYAEALRIYESLAAVPGKSQEASRQGLLRCLLITGQYERVETLATTYLQTSPETSDWNFFLGRALVLRGKHAEAKSALAKAAQGRAPLAIDAQLQLALLLKSLGDAQSRQLFSAAYERANAAGNRLGVA